MMVLLIINTMILNYFEGTMRLRNILGTLVLILAIIQVSIGQHSVARKWNEVLLEGIRNDFARPTIHARNLFQISAAMYDAWAVYDNSSATWLLGKWHREYYCPFEGITIPSDVQAAREEAISFAAYRMIMHRFNESPGRQYIQGLANDLMDELGYEISSESTDYSVGFPAALGNYIAQSMIEIGLQDGSKEEGSYKNLFYETVNPPLTPTDDGNPFIINDNRWQPLFIETFIDQSGNPIPMGLIDFLSPEWGHVIPFSLKPVDVTIYEKDSTEYWVYHDPGVPPYIEASGEGMTSEYQWGFALVSQWSSHLDPTDGVMWDISPASIGNVQNFPSTIEGYRNFYDALEGGDTGMGHDLNPHTGKPYEPQIVPRGDYGRVLAEFWADGPDSETPPGHWFTIINWVNDRPELEKKFRGEGDILDDLEWDIKAYFILGGTMHDVAITAWGIKGWYDYIRPISAIRAMADRGQSSNPDGPNYAPDGIPLTEGYIELVTESDPLAGEGGKNTGKIKLLAWKGPEYIDDPTTDYAGVDWILAERWWPYQRPSFVTPPFAGYISGHSTFSRAAAEVLTLLTGDEYFPGGMGEFIARKNQFLVFEEGPSMDITLQWATYQDASDQCSLSRIWGGIHPPADDIPGRIIGAKIGKSAFVYAEKYFLGLITDVYDYTTEPQWTVYPNPVQAGNDFTVISHFPSQSFSVEIFNAQGKRIRQLQSTQAQITISTSGLIPGIYLIRQKLFDGIHTNKLIVL